jgi:hypothetical protein
MGRTKAGRTKRVRPVYQEPVAAEALPELRPLTVLHSLVPPGGSYDNWYNISPGMDLSRLEADPRIGVRAVEAMKMVVHLAPIYGGRVPEAAVKLDSVAQSGSVWMREAGGATVSVPLTSLFERLGAGRQPGSPGNSPDPAQWLRVWLHTVHAAALVVMDDDLALRLPVTLGQGRAGDEDARPWVFMDELGVEAAGLFLAALRGEPEPVIGG